jgi:starch synthase
MPTAKKLDILYVSAEVAPFSKAGGLADVAFALPRAVKRLGHDVAIITPLYGCVDRKKARLQDLVKDIKIEINGIKETFTLQKAKLLKPEIEVFFINHYRLFGRRRKIYNYYDDAYRFLVFDLAVLEAIKIMEKKFDIVHCHDWHSGLIPNFLKLKNYRSDKLKNLSTIYTIHNLAFQGRFDHWRIQKKNRDVGSGLPCLAPRKIRWINFARRGLRYADAVSTVSAQYAKEILTPEYGEGLHLFLERHQSKIFGIMNGIDYEVFNPAIDPYIKVKYDIKSLAEKIKNKLALQKEFKLPVNEKIPIIGMASRITEQKGFDLIRGIMPHLLKLNLQLILVGGATKEYGEYFRYISRKYPKLIAAHLKFSVPIASRIYAGADFFLMPSRYEPSGLGQMISLRYGTIPIVRKTGGLAETITNFSPLTRKGNGFVFDTYDETELLVAIVRALETYKNKPIWQRLIKKGMKESYSWKIPAERYVRLYKLAIKLNKRRRRK